MAGHRPGAGRAGGAAGGWIPEPKKRARRRPPRREARGSARKRSRRRSPARWRRRYQAGASRKQEDPSLRGRSPRRSRLGSCIWSSILPDPRMPSRAAAEVVGISIPSADRIVKEAAMNPYSEARRYQLDMPGPKPWEKLSPDSQQALRDINTFRELFFARRPQVWVYDASMRIVDASERSEGENLHRHERVPRCRQDDAGDGHRVLARGRRWVL